MDVRLFRIEGAIILSFIAAGISLIYYDDNGSPATDIAATVVKRLLRDGFILLPSGDPPNIVAFTPPLTVGKLHITKLIRALGQALEEAYK